MAAVAEPHRVRVTGLDVLKGEDRIAGQTLLAANRLLPSTERYSFMFVKVLAANHALNRQCSCLTSLLWVASTPVAADVPYDRARLARPPRR